MDKGTDCSLMFKVSHKESYFKYNEISNFRILVYIYSFQAAVSGLLTVGSFVYWKKSKQILHNNSEIRDFVKRQIAFLMRYFKLKSNYNIW